MNKLERDILAFTGISVAALSLIMGSLGRESECTNKPIFLGEVVVCSTEGKTIVMSKGIEHSFPGRYVTTIDPWVYYVTVDKNTQHTLWRYDISLDELEEVVKYYPSQSPY